MIIQLPTTPKRPSQQKSAPTDKYNHGGSPRNCWLVRMWRSWSCMDRSLFAAVIFVAAAEIIHQVRAYNEKKAGADEEGSEGGGESALASASSDVAASKIGAAWAAIVSVLSSKQAGVIACAVGVILSLLCGFYRVYLCLRQNRQSSQAGVQLRDRNASSNWFVAAWRKCGTFDRVLFVVAFTLVGAEVIFELSNYKKKKAGEEGKGESASEAASGGAAWDAFSSVTAKQVGIVACVVGAVAISICACLFFRRSRQSNSAGFQLRDRNASRKSGCNPCTIFFNWWRRAQLLDKVLVVCVVMFVVVDGAMTLKEQGLPEVHVKLPNLRGSILFPTDAPTASPTPVPPPPPEDPKEVAAAMKSAAARTYAHVGCTPAQIGQVQSSGITGDACRGKPYTQSCSFSQMTKVHKASWLGHFAEEVRDARAAAVNTTHTFLGFMAHNDASDCVKIDNDAKSLQFMFQGPPDEASDSAVQAGKDILKSPILFCTSPHAASKEFEDKWGLKTGNLGGTTLDQFMIDNSEAKEIKDVVHITTGGDSFAAINGGWVTLARTRYVEFNYDWQKSWAGGNLETVVNKLNELGHTCYWPGDDKLWRITDCWQPFYGFKSYSNVACVNRYLAPKLAEAMEKLFLKTIETA